MKATQGELPPQFTPITLTIETLDEALTIWHRMNISNYAFREAYDEEERLDKFIDESSKVFDALSNLSQFKKDAKGSL